jgi:hypothetical protein
MNFEESLVYELSSIEGLSKKIFPLSAVAGVETPFLVYVSSEGEEDRTLNGFIGSKQITCEIHIIANSYSELKRITRSVIEKIKTFWGRQIGVNGVYIKSVAYDPPVETVDEELNLRRSAFDLRVRI